MNKIKFLNFLNHPESISEVDLPKLETLAEQHPYSQVIHILVAKGRHNLGLETFRVGLHKAAISANNRDLLKKLIEDVKVSNMPPLEAEVTSPPSEATSPSELLEETIIATEEAIIEPAEKSTAVDHETNALLEKSGQEEDTSNLVTEALQEEIQDLPESEHLQKPDLDDEVGLNLSKPNVVEPDDPGKPAHLATEDQEIAEENGIHSELMANLEKLKQQREKLDKEKEAEKASEAAIHEETSDLTNDEPPVSEASTDNIDSHDEPNANEELIFDPPTHELSEDLLPTQEPEANEAPVESDITEQQKSQLEIIDSFIKNSPVLSKPNLSADSEATSQTDLSIKSAKFHQDFVSENLASILAKQGKRKDAVGIYKKLMVKFPEKKGYFADQIESLNTK